MKKISFCLLIMCMISSSILSANNYKSDEEFSFKESVEILVDRIMQVEKVLAEKRTVALDEKFIKEIEFTDDMKKQEVKK